MTIDKFFTLSEQEQNIAYEQAVSKWNLGEYILEKDLWVCIVLKYLFNDFKYKDYLVFKGGTSLSKAHNLIKRFSEDIDLSMDIRVLGYPDGELNKSKSNSQLKKFNKNIKEENFKFLKEEVLPILQHDLGKIFKDKEIKLYIEESDPYTICFDYPKKFPVRSSILKIIKLEMGRLADPEPASQKEIKPYIFETFPNVAWEKIFVKTVEPIRIFYEKATILHRIANRYSQIYPDRYARHYYDLYKMLQTDLEEQSLQNLDLLDSVIEFKKKYYPTNTAKYDLIYEAKLKLVPSQEAIDFFKNDYKNMNEMFFEDIVSFDEIIKTLQIHEDKLNKEIKTYAKWSSK
ncbi:nucleotidyl transferase AbiEii/AbiGii toxin family protein [Mycoplasmopsis citelli]|uniref:nucleotidyl transferase AbiEii/AbiGii toxin family protein n=1 Tax=Mycoplasmopsis citelli TaxID=171281 RepID=UPI00211535AB|nr:nucleotidyl transferase AbiEii/AbiGii toxin family protein [Mycoplasmopsis citelli]UUD36578.1 nucleotidyl transferase AbiEii/AbiGii toxin family protein [Mycoplasmopsis citelli]